MTSLTKIKSIIETHLGNLDHLSAYLFGSYAYWYAKAQLTLVDKQHSLNEHSLVYIYSELLRLDIDDDSFRTLELLQFYRSKIRSDDYLDIDFESFRHHFGVIVRCLEHNK